MGRVGAGPPVTSLTPARVCVQYGEPAPTRPKADRAGADTPRCLIPFDRREGITIEEAAARAGRDVRTLRRWCVEHGIGRRIAGGPWTVSRVALAMLLNGDRGALRLYLTGDRNSSDVSFYFVDAGLNDLLQRWNSGRLIEA